MLLKGKKANYEIFSSVGMQGMGGNPMMVQQRMQMQGAQMGQMGQMNPNMQQRMMRPGVQVQGM